MQGHFVIVDNFSSKLGFHNCLSSFIWRLLTFQRALDAIFDLYPFIYLNKTKYHSAIYFRKSSSRLHTLVDTAPNHTEEHFRDSVKIMSIKMNQASTQCAIFLIVVQVSLKSVHLLALKMFRF
jgi:hypothetical protein